MIEAPLPTQAERKNFLEYIGGVAKRIYNKAVQYAKGLNTEQVANLTSGMTLIGMENFIKKSSLQNQVITPQQISQAKADDIRNQSQGTLEVCNPEYGLKQVGGLKSFKLYFTQLLEHFKRAARDVPQGMLLAGVPGSGKTYLAKALAHELGWTFVQLAKIRDSYYGASEERLVRALSVVRQMGHVLLFIDEMDQVFGRRDTGQSGDSGTSANLWAYLAKWMAEPSLEERC